MAYIESFNGKTPRIHESAIIAPTAVLIGDVTVDEGVSIWPNTVVRGDFAPIYIGAYTNIQDNSTVHADLDTPLCIEPYVLIGHNSMIHGIRIGTCTLIGMSSCISVQTDIGAGCIVGAGSVLPQGKRIADRSLIFGSPARFVRELDDAAVARTKHEVMRYHDFAVQYPGWKV